jgi:hypothetical protein
MLWPPVYNTSMNLSLLNFLALLAFSVSAMAQSPFDGVASSKIEFIEFQAGRVPNYPAWFKWVVNPIHSWESTGAPAKGLTASCRYDQLGSLLNLSDNYASNLKDYLNQCEQEVEAGIPFAPFHTYRMLNMKFEIDAHPFMRKVMLNLPGGSKIKGLLGLKPGSTPRPLIVLRAGVHSSVDELYPERFLIQQLFEQSPFHILVVGNMTGRDFIENNEKFSFGGFDEGRQNIAIAQILRDPKEPIAQRISELALVGISLGGHGVYYAAHLNELNEQLYSSFIGLCPVVNLRDSMEGLLSPFYRGIAVDYWSENRLQPLVKKYNDYIAPNWMDLLFRRRSFLREIMERVEKSFSVASISGDGIRLPVDQNINNFWQANDIWQSTITIKKPFLTLYNKWDPLVRPTANVMRLPDYLKRQAVRLQSGYHCTLPVAYDWEFMHLTLEQFLLRNFKSWKGQDRHFVLTENGSWAPQNKPSVGDSLDWKIKYLNESGITFSFSNNEINDLTLPWHLTPLLSFYKEPSFASMVQRWASARLQFEKQDKHINLLIKNEI